MIIKRWDAEFYLEPDDSREEVLDIVKLLILNRDIQMLSIKIYYDP